METKPDSGRLVFVTATLPTQSKEPKNYGKHLQTASFMSSIEGFTPERGIVFLLLLTRPQRFSGLAGIQTKKQKATLFVSTFALILCQTLRVNNTKVFTMDFARQCCGLYFIMSL
jgi:hypothetical protein